MKRLMMTLAVVLFDVIDASAATEVVDGVTWTYSVSNGKASVYTGSSLSAIPTLTKGALTIPATLGGCPVTSIGEYAFYGCRGLTSVTIPEGVTSIGERAFSGCSGLASVTIPEGVTSIGDRAFYCCVGLTSVTIPEGVTSIGVSAFGSCSGLTRVDITDLEKWCRISFAPSVANPLSCAHHLYLNGEEIKDLIIPVGVTGVGSFAFTGCSGLTSVTIPEGVTSIGECAFSGCSGLTSVTIPEGVTSIGERAFYGCCGLTLVTIPEGVTSIGSSAFFDCSGLTSVTIPEGVTSIESSAFRGCSGLTSVTIPEGVTSIGERAFYGCCGLTLVTIPEGVASIGEYAFYGCSGLTSVTIPEGVTSIGSCAFRGCSGLTSVTIPEGVTSIGSSAFSDCNGLTSVEFLGPPPNGLSGSYLLKYGRASYPREYGKDWLKFWGINSFPGYGQGKKPQVEIVSAAIRENNPTVMDVVYKVVSAKPTVKVRALAFQDGERSFAKVVRPTEFIEDTAKNIGDEIAANEEHKLSWRVSADWKVDLAKVKFEVLASDGDLLPLELTEIPKIGDHAAMEISWNAMTEQQVLDALLWLFADGNEGLTLSNGVLKNGAAQLVYKTSLSAVNAIGYVYGKMGFSVLSGDELKYANEMTRLGLSPSGVRQYAWRAVEE